MNEALLSRLRPRFISVATVWVLCFGMLWAFACSKPEQPAAPGPSSPKAEQPATETEERTSRRQIADVTGRDLSQFDHNTEGHKAIDCRTCHARPDNRVMPELPDHPACINCHSNIYTDLAFRQRQDFCERCHLWPVEPVENRLVSFPASMKQFGIKAFSHQDHMDPNKTPAHLPDLTCASCHHQRTRGLQVAFPGHQECYTCHTHDSEEPAGGCGVCHADKELSIAYRTRSRLAFSNFRFSHTTHLKEPTIAGDCKKCHESNAGTEHVDITGVFPKPGMIHSSGCWSCHKQEKEPSCLKCHENGPPISLASLPNVDGDVLRSD